ncbi:hypothetical protein U1Q18_013099 [Sarracenia purpurea var. burkii]
MLVGYHILPIYKQHVGGYHCVFAGSFVASNLLDISRFLILRSATGFSASFGWSWWGVGWHLDTLLSSSKSYPSMAHAQTLGVSDLVKSYKDT